MINGLLLCHVVDNSFQVSSEATLDELLVEQSSAHGEAPRTDLEHLVDALVAGDGACNADLGLSGIESCAEVLCESFAINNVTVCKNVKALDALFLQSLCLSNDLLIGAFQNGGRTVDLANEGEVLNTSVSQLLVDGLIVDGAAEAVETAVDSGLCAGQAALFVVGNDFEVGGLASSLHSSGARLHNADGLVNILEAPVLYGQVLASVEDVLALGMSLVVMGEHYDDFGFH